MSQIFYIRTRTRSKCFWSVTVEIYIPIMSSRFQILRTRNLESSTWNPESTDCLRFTYMVLGGMGLRGRGGGVLWGYKSKTATSSFCLQSLAAVSRHDLTGTCRWMWYGFLPLCLELWTSSGSRPDKREYDMACKTGIDIWTIPNRRTLSEFI